MIVIYGDYMIVELHREQKKAAEIRRWEERRLNCDSALEQLCGRSSMDN